MKKIITICVIGSIMFFAAPGSEAQQPVRGLTDDTFFPYQQDDADMKSAKSGASFKTKGFQYGGWITPSYIDDNDGKKNLGSAITTARLWLKSYLWDNAFIYLRGKDVFSQIVKRDGYDKGQLEDQGFKNDKKNYYDLDAGFITMASESGKLKFSIGRIFFMLGSGLVLNGRGDGAELGVYAGSVSVEVFGSYTGFLRKDDDPYRLSTRDNTDGSRRVFTGGSASYDFSNQTFYLLGMAEIDRGEQSATEKTRYQAQYYGGGFKGVLLRAMSYNAEFVYETGKSYTQQGKQAAIKAYAGVVNMNYYFDAAMNPSLIIQYAYGSGDKDKSNYTLPNSNGKGDDTGFLPFGTYVGGYALRPVLSNIHIARGGFSVSPFSGSQSSTLKRLSLIGKYSYYMKDKVSQPIKAGEATEKERNIGQGIDGSLRWGLFDDLSVFVNYALFLPGKAYSSTENDEKRKFMMGGLNLIF